MEQVVAKMQCQVIETQTRSHAKHRKVKLGAVHGTSGENKDFSDATPNGECWMDINDGRVAVDFFKPGKKYYVTFTEAPD
jgi:hypothetical protein